MTEAIHVRKGEHGVYRVFSIDLPDGEVEAFQTQTYPEDEDERVIWPLRDALGAEYLDHDFIEVIDVDELGELGLAGYLVEGVGIDPDEIGPHARGLGNAAGKVLIVFSDAFGGSELRLEPRAPLRLIAELRDKPVVPVMEPLSSDSAKGVLDGAPDPAPQRKKGSGLIALIGLVVIVLLFILLRGWA